MAKGQGKSLSNHVGNDREDNSVSVCVSSHEAIGELDKSSETVEMESIFWWFSHRETLRPTICGAALRGT